MIPFLHTADDIAFNTNGLGPMADAIDCTVERQLNGIYELEMVYPVTGRRYSDIQLRNIVRSSVGPDERTQPFRIYRITRPMNGKVTIYAQHIAYDLKGFPVAPFSAESLAEALEQLQGDAAVKEHLFTFSTDKIVSSPCTVSVPRSIWSMLGGAEGSLLDLYGGEWQWDRLQLKLMNRLGADLGVTIRYGKNLTSYEQDENCANTWTGVYPYWTDEAGAVVELPERILEAEGTFDHVRIMMLDLSMEWDEAPSEETMRTRAQKYMTDNDIGKPSVGWTLGFVDLSQTEEYKNAPFLQKIHLGDSATIRFDKMGVRTVSRVVRYTWKPLLDRYDNIRLGNVRANLGQSLAQLQRTAIG